MSSYESIPLTLKTGAGDGSIQQSDAALEEWMAYWASEKVITSYPNTGDRYSKSLTLDSANADLIGTYVDTFYNEPVGTHPGTSISEGTISTNLYQIADSASTTRYIRSYPIPVVTDSDGDIYEMQDAGILELAQRIAGQVHVNTFAGAFRLSETSPGSGWRKWIDSAFTDNTTSGDVVYHIWRLTENSLASEPTVPDHFPLALKDGVSPDLREITKEEAKEIAREILLIGQVSTGVGDYELRSSAQGAPTASGTWVARGTALDTKHIVSPVQYSSEQFTSPQFSRQYTGQYAGQYTGISFANVDRQYSGSRGGQFTGSRNYSAQYQGSRNYSGQYQGSRNYGEKYAGPRTYGGVRYFSGGRYYSANYAGNTKFGGLSPVTYYVLSYYSGSRQKDKTFAGSRLYPYAGYYAGVRSRDYSGPRRFEYADSFVGARTRTQVVYQQYAGARSFAGARAFGNSYAGAQQSWSGTAQQFNGQYRPGQLPFSRDISFPFTGYFSGNYVRVFSPPSQPAFFPTGGQPTPGPGGGNPINEQFRQNLQREGDSDVSPFDVFEVYYAGFRTNFSAGVIQQFWSGQRVVQYAGPGFYSGGRLYAGARYYSRGFTGFRNFAGSRTNYSIVYRWFNGNRLYFVTEQFAGPYPQNFQGSRQRNVGQNFVGQRSFGSNYALSQVFYVQLPAQYSGVRYFAGERVNRFQFTRNQNFAKTEYFIGSRNYARQYVGSRNYVAQYQGSRNYGGTYAGSRVFQFTGQVPTTYSRQYTGYYTGVYTGNYTSQYSNQYTGQTITSQKETIETFTLYCRISDT